MSKAARIVLCVVVAGAVVAVVTRNPASAFFAIVNDPINGIKLVSQLTNQATQISNEVKQITNQGTQIVNEARNLSKLPKLNLGNISAEVNSVISDVNAVPQQLRGVVASAKVLENSVTDGLQASSIAGGIGSADGAVQQQQIGNEQLGNIEGSITQGNAAAAAQRVQDFANSAEQADAGLTITGNTASASDKTPTL